MSWGKFYPRCEKCGRVAAGEKASLCISCLRRFIRESNPVVRDLSSSYTEQVGRTNKFMKGKK